MSAEVAFRADAARDMGSGHVVRCVSLADELRRRGVRTRFIARYLPPALEAGVLRRGHAVVRLPVPAVPDPDLTGYARWLGVRTDTDAIETAGALDASGGAEWLVYDHYALDARWSRIAREHSKRVLAIDDLADRAHECDVLLDQTPCSDPAARYRHLVPAGCRQLLGPRFALIRGEFLAARAAARIRNDGIHSILVALGAFAEEAHLATILGGLGRLVKPDGIRVNVIGETRPPTAQYGFELIFHGFVEHPAQLLLTSDLAIGGAGTSAWERCCLALPSVVLVIADNQRLTAEGLANSGCAINLGSLSSVQANAVSEVVGNLIREPARVAQMSSRASGLVDGLGAGRVADEMGII